MDRPIWWLEERLLDLFEWLTGCDSRRVLRRIVLALSIVLVIGGELAHVLIQPHFLCFVTMTLIWLFWLPRWLYPRGPLWYLPSQVESAFVRFWTALCIYTALGSGLLCLLSDVCILVINLGLAAVWLSDYILWAEYMDRPRKRHESLPEHLRRLFAAFCPAMSPTR